MRVLHIFNEINFSGAEIMYANAAPFFQQQGFQLLAISTGDNFGNFTQQFINAGIEIYHKPFKPKSLNPIYLWKYLKSINVFIKKNHVDIIHIHRSNVFWYFSLCGFLSRKKVISTLHSVFKAGKYTWLKHYLTRYTARKFFNLTFQTIGKSVFLNELNYFKNPTVQVNNWYNAEKFFPAINEDEKSSLRCKFNISEEAFVIISVGRCVALKNHIDIIKACALIENDIDIVYLHLGSGELEDDEKHSAHVLNVGQKVRFLGNQTNVRDYLVASDVFIMTSDCEGLSIASIEAMACGLPSILYNSTGLRDLINNDDNGFLVEHSYEFVKEAILKFKSISLRHEKAAHALNHVRSSYSMAGCVNGIVQLYKS